MKALKFQEWMGNKDQNKVEKSIKSPTKKTISGYTLAASELLDPKTAKEIQDVWEKAKVEGRLNAHQSQEMLERLMESGYRWKECLTTLMKAGFWQA